MPSLPQFSQIRLVLGPPRSLSLLAVCGREAVPKAEEERVTNHVAHLDTHKSVGVSWAVVECSQQVQRSDPLQHLEHHNWSAVSSFGLPCTKRIRTYLLPDNTYTKFIFSYLTLLFAFLSCRLTL